VADLASILRGSRLAVTEIPGWRTHVRPGAWQPVGLIVHHTAGTNSLRTIVNGRPDLPGPLANLHVPKWGGVNVVSAGRCNHAGAGAALVLEETRRDVAPTGSALARGLLDGPGGNGYFYGIEAENRGDGEDPWPPEQLDTIARICAALCAHHGWRSNRVIGHTEWTRRKIDPRGFSMVSMRARVAMLLLQRPAPVPTPIPEPLLEEDPMFLAWDPNDAYLVFRDASTGTLMRTYVGDLKEVEAIEASCQGGKRLVAPKLLARIPVTT
jgi:hypothetical protein